MAHPDHPLYNMNTTMVDLSQLPPAYNIHYLFNMRRMVIKEMNNMMCLFSQNHDYDPSDHEQYTAGLTRKDKAVYRVNQYLWVKLVTGDIESLADMIMENNFRCITIFIMDDNGNV